MNEQWMNGDKWTNDEWTTINEPTMNERMNEWTNNKWTNNTWTNNTWTNDEWTNDEWTMNESQTNNDAGKSEYRSTKIKKSFQHNDDCCVLIHHPPICHSGMVCTHLLPWFSQLNPPLHKILVVTIQVVVTSLWPSTAYKVCQTPFYMYGFNHSCLWRG